MERNYTHIKCLCDICLRVPPEISMRCLILCMTQKEVEKRAINMDDIQALKLYQADLYTLYLHCKVVRIITYRDLIDSKIILACESISTV